MIKNILPKSNASASLLAHVVTSKFDDGLPIFRICRQLERQEVRLTPGTMGTWVNTVGSETVVPLINLMNDDLLADSLVQMDETYLQVLQSEKAPSSEHYAYLNFLFENLPAANTVEALEALLPWNARNSLPTTRRAA